MNKTLDSSNERIQFVIHTNKFQVKPTTLFLKKEKKSSKFLISKAFRNAYILFQSTASWQCNIIRHFKIVVPCSTVCNID